jgi:hypothetical protein
MESLVLRLRQVRLLGDSKQVGVYCYFGVAFIRRFGQIAQASFLFPITGDSIASS